LLFFKTEKDGHNSKSTHNIVYHIIPFALRPVEHYDFLSIPKTPQHWTLHEKQPTSTSPEEEHGPSYSNVDTDFPEQTLSSNIVV
jgi:hypothetical protein